MCVSTVHEKTVNCFLTIDRLATDGGEKKLHDDCVLNEYNTPTQTLPAHHPSFMTFSLSNVTSLKLHNNNN